MRILESVEQRKKIDSWRAKTKFWILFTSLVINNMPVAVTILNHWRSIHGRPSQPHPIMSIGRGFRNFLRTAQYPQTVRSLFVAILGVIVHRDRPKLWSVHNASDDEHEYRKAEHRQQNIHSDFHGRHVVREIVTGYRWESATVLSCLNGWFVDAVVFRYSDKNVSKIARITGVFPFPTRNPIVLNGVWTTGWIIWIKVYLYGSQSTCQWTRRWLWALTIKKSRKIKLWSMKWPYI